MFEKNVGKVDSYIRYGIAGGAGLAALLLGPTSPFFVGLLVVAAAMGITGAIGRCGLYKLIGVNTCPLEQRK